MNITVIAGIVITGVVLGIIAFLVLWSNNTINKIAERKNKTLRSIIRERRGGR